MIGTKTDKTDSFAVLDSSRFVTTEVRGTRVSILFRLRHRRGSATKKFNSKLFANNYGEPRGVVTDFTNFRLLCNSFLKRVYFLEMCQGI